MNKMIMNRLTMLAVTLMASMACFAQGKSVTTIGGGMAVDSIFDYLELQYKVLENATGYTVEVVGFSDAFKADPTLFDSSDDIKTHNTVTLYHIIGESDKVQVKTYVARVAAGALNTTDATLASKVTAIEIDYSDDMMATAPVIIGENAFAGLTSVATVESYTPGEEIQAIPTDAFADAVYLGASLYVPNCAMGKYAKLQGWKKFASIYNADGELFGDINGNGSVAGNDVTALKRVLAGTRAETDACDVNSNGSVAGNDVTALKRVVAGTY